MDADANNHEKVRLVLAIIISPVVPILALSIAYWVGTGSKAWFPIFFLFGYIFFFLIGLPVVGILLRKKTILNFAIGGGCTSVAPILLLNLFSLFSGNKILTAETLVSLGALFIAGVFGGMLFWVIAFAEIKSKIKKSDHSRPKQI